MAIDGLHCFYCQAYIGKKLDLEDFFFHCNKECFDKYEEKIALSDKEIEKHFKKLHSVPDPNTNIDNTTNLSSNKKRKPKKKVTES